MSNRVTCLGHRFPVFLVRSVAVEEDGHADLLGQPLPEPLGHRNALLHLNVAHGNERADVERAHAGMLSAVLSHVDELEGRLWRTQDHSAAKLQCHVSHGPLHWPDMISALEGA